MCELKKCVCGSSELRICLLLVNFMCIVNFQVPTMYTRLLQGYKTMDPDQQKAAASAAKQLRLVVIVFFFSFLYKIFK